MKQIKRLLAIVVVGLLAFAAGAQSFLTNGLVAYYPFKGNANDVVGTNNGVIYGGVTLAPDRFGSNNSAYLFDGTDGYIDIGNPTGDTPSNLTETAWVNIITRINDPGAEPFTATEDILISKRQTGDTGAGWADLGVFATVNEEPDTTGTILISADYYLQYCLGDIPTETNVWFAIGEVCSNGTYQVYINGVLSGTLSDGTSLYSDEDMYLMHCGAWNTFCHGEMNDVRIYDRALSTNEMAELYQYEDEYEDEASPHAATATATLVNGFVVGATIIDQGLGYTNTPSVRFIGGGGSGAEAVAVVSNGVVTAIDITSAGSDYTNEPIVVIDPPFIPSPGFAIQPVSLLTFSNLVIGDSYQLQELDSWYWTNEPVSFTATQTVYTAQAGPGLYRLALNPVPAQAFATPQVDNGFVVGATVTAGGSGYTNPPAVTIVGDVGSDATAVASISDGAVTGISITDAGIGYTNLVAVEIAPPPATALSPTVVPGIQLNSSSLVPYDNYQVQFAPAPGAPWENWNGGLINSTNGVNYQFIPATNSAAFFRLEYVP
jgi:hypothetical protein